jgi:hypothetical protein
MAVFDPTTIIPPEVPPPHPEADMTWWHGPASDLDGLDEETLKMLADLYAAAHPFSTLPNTADWARELGIETPSGSDVSGPGSRESEPEVSTPPPNV